MPWAVANLPWPPNTWGQLFYIDVNGYVFFGKGGAHQGDTQGGTAREKKEESKK
jgi:hypothetical protein